MTTDPKTIVLGWTDALNRHDLDAADEFWTEDGVFTNMGADQRAEGRAAIHDHHTAVLAMWSEFHIETTSFLIGEGGHYAKEWILTGVHTGDAPGLPATGRPFRVRGASVGEVRNGLIITDTIYWNMADFLIQVGLLPSAGQ